jgi:putative transposase
LSRIRNIRVIGARMMDGVTSPYSIPVLTHRCHNRAFLLKFARDREAYRALMRSKLREFEVSLLDYCVTCNHVHLLAEAEDKLQISGFMREVAGEFARQYNRRKERLNAVWGDNFHATLVDGGSYLWRCLSYIELNMVRCGVVKHPSQWEWLGYHEIMGRRRRYRLVDLERLCWRLGTTSLVEVRKNLEAALQERIQRDGLKREPCWTESLAVGGPEFVKRIQPLMLSRRETEIVEEQPGIWALKETEVSYSSESGSKSDAKV